MSHSHTHGPDDGTRSRVRWILISLALAVAAMGSLFALDRDGRAIETAQSIGAEFVTAGTASTAPAADRDAAAADAESASLLDDFRPDVDRHAPSF